MNISELRKTTLERVKKITNNYSSDNIHRVLEIERDIFIPHEFGFVRAGRVHSSHNVERHIHVHIEMFRDNPDETLGMEESELYKELLGLIYEYWVKYAKKRSLEGFFFVFADSLWQPESSYQVYNQVKNVLPDPSNKLVDNVMRKAIERPSAIGSWRYMGGVYSPALQKKVISFVEFKTLVEGFIEVTPDLHYSDLFNELPEDKCINFRGLNIIKYKNVKMSIDIDTKEEMLNVEYYDDCSHFSGEFDEVAKEHNLKQVSLKTENLREWINKLDCLISAQSYTTK